MADFINTIEILGDDNVVDSIIDRSITEFKDNSITTLGESVFRGCVNLVNVSLPLLEDTGTDAFFGCTSLESLELPKLKYIRNGAFTNATALKTVFFPDAVLGADINPGQSAFQNCAALTSAYIPKLPYIPNYFFFGCTSLATMDLTSCNDIGGYYSWARTTVLKALVLRNTETVATLRESHTFRDAPIGKGTGYIYVPRALVESYKVATNWSTYATQFRALEDYTVDGTITGDLDETKI